MSHVTLHHQNTTPPCHFHNGPMEGEVSKTLEWFPHCVSVSNHAFVQQLLILIFKWPVLLLEFPSGSHKVRRSGQKMEGDLDFSYGDLHQDQTGQNMIVVDLTRSD